MFFTLIWFIFIAHIFIPLLLGVFVLVISIFLPWFILNVHIFRVSEMSLSSTFYENRNSLHSSVHTSHRTPFCCVLKKDIKKCTKYFVLPGKIDSWHNQPWQLTWKRDSWHSHPWQLTAYLERETADSLPGKGDSWHNHSWQLTAYLKRETADKNILDS